jgi:hypothetical protein
VAAAELDPSAYEHELRRVAGGSQWRYEKLRWELARTVRRGEAVQDRRAAPLAVIYARRVQRQKTWPLTVIVPTLVLGVLGFMIGGFALIWYLLTVVPTVLTEPMRARRRRDRALSAEAANLALLDDTGDGTGDGTGDRTADRDREDDDGGE